MKEITAFVDDIEKKFVRFHFFATIDYFERISEVMHHMKYKLPRYQYELEIKVDVET